MQVGIRDPSVSQLIATMHRAPHITTSRLMLRIHPRSTAC